MPVVSIILPTFNRADTILRAVRSVLAQSFSDWELLVIDDGSTDDTAALVTGLDARIHIIHQKNAGVYVARNNGLKRSRGEYITFLDSDDEWMPNFLAITVAFLRAHPEEHFVSTEFLQDWGTSECVRHDYQIITQAHLKKARTFGSSALELPAESNDDYLRIYAEKHLVGDWAACGLADDGKTVYRYRGKIFDHMRWGYLNWLPAIMITRKAAQTVGPFREEFRNGADFYFLACLARTFHANMIGIPCAFKHEKTHDAKSLKEGHLAGGENSYRLAATHLQFFEELFLNKNSDDEIILLHKSHHLECGRAALRLGKRSIAINHLRRSLHLGPVLWRGYMLLAVAALSMSGHLAAFIYRGSLRIDDIWRRAVK